jgi:hypothetical protein
MTIPDSGDNGGRQRRKHLRVRISVKAQLEAPPRASVHCDIYNVSVGGALLACSASLYLGQPVVLHMEEFDALKAHIARVTSTVFALVFDDPDHDALATFIESHQQKAEDRASAAAVVVNDAV